MEHTDILVIGGGAAGFFGAITAAQSQPGTRVLIAERGPQPLAKVRISGGGRCNVTHACFEPRPLSSRYPRGARALLSAFSRFQPADTVRWFESRGVPLKTEADGRMFPTSDCSESIIACLEREAVANGVELQLRCGVDRLALLGNGKWEVSLSSGTLLHARKVLIATGGCRTGGPMELLQSLGHEIIPPVPSLFTFHIQEEWVQRLAGLAVPSVELSVAENTLKETGPVLFTHWGLSGPGVLRLSAWGARELHALDYQFTLRVRWCPQHGQDQLRALFAAARAQQPGKAIVNTPMCGLPARLWEQLLNLADVAPEQRWNQLPRHAELALISLLLRTELPVSGKSMNKDEFVTCGGVSLKEVDFKTMQSRLHPGLHFAGEVLDLDGITGGFNFQAAWTTGWLAGRAMVSAEDA